MAQEQDYLAMMPDLDAYLEGKYGQASGSSKVTLNRRELESAWAKWQDQGCFIDYFLGVIDGIIPESVEKSLLSNPVSFVYSYVGFVTALANTKGNPHTRDIRENFYNDCAIDLSKRIESVILNREQLGVISGAEDRFNKMHGSKGVARRIETSNLNGNLLSLCQRVLNEHLGDGEAFSHRRFLLAMDGLIHYTRNKKSFDYSDLEQLVALYHELHLQVAEQNATRTSEKMYPGQLLAAQEVAQQLESALSWKLLKAETNEITKALVLRLKALNQGKGARPDSFGMILLEIICRFSQSETSDLTWWEPLNLSELLEVTRRSSALQIGILDATAKGDWFRKMVERHVAESESVKHLSIALEANTIFGIPDAEGLIRVWKTAAGKSAVLQDIEAELVSSPLQMMKSKGETLLSEQEILHQNVNAALKAEIAKLQSAISSLDAAMQKGRESLGDAKLGLEMGVTKKFAEAIARLVRRMEREAGKAPFQEILAKEVNGLSRLGMTVIPAGTVEPFDPAKHDSIGVTIPLGASVTIIETGLLLLLGKDTITVLKAVVHPAV